MAWYKANARISSIGQRRFSCDSVRPKHQSFPWILSFSSYGHCSIEQWMKKVFPNGHPSFSLDLIKRFLNFDPNKRITAEQALNDLFFKQQPLPHQE